MPVRPSPRRASPASWSISRLKCLRFKPYGLTFRGKSARLFHLVLAWRRCAAVLHFIFFKVEAR